MTSTRLVKLIQRDFINGLQKNLHKKYECTATLVSNLTRFIPTGSRPDRGVHPTGGYASNDVRPLIWLPKSYNISGTGVITPSSPYSAALKTHYHFGELFYRLPSPTDRKGKWIKASAAVIETFSAYPRRFYGKPLFGYDPVDPKRDRVWDVWYNNEDPDIMTLRNLSIKILTPEDAAYNSSIYPAEISNRFHI